LPESPGLSDKIMCMKKYKVSLISYLNSKPFLFGLLNSPVIHEIELHLDMPSLTAAKLATNQTDIGLIPVGALVDLPDYHIISDHCIGSVGPVRTVVLASNVPLEEVDTILLDYQSRSSVLLIRTLAYHFWKREFRWENTSGDFEKNRIAGHTAGVVIGDRVFEVEKRYPYIWDLSSEWMKFTGFPFVFAVWVSQKQLPPSFLDRFKEAIAFGVNNVREVEKSEQSKFPDVDIFEYFTRNISYNLDEPKLAGMNRFLQLAREMESTGL